MEGTLDMMHAQGFESQCVVLYHQSSQKAVCAPDTRSGIKHRLRYIYQLATTRR